MYTYIAIQYSKAEIQIIDKTPHFFIFGNLAEKKQEEAWNEKTQLKREGGDEKKTTFQIALLPNVMEQIY